MKSHCIAFSQRALVSVCLLSAFGVAWAKAPSDGQTNQQPSSATGSAAQSGNGQATKSPQQEYVIGPEDELNISVWKQPDISRSVPVRPDGKISLPLVGELQASGLTASQLQDVIIQKLKAYISNPEVNVIVQDVKSRTFNVVGKVAKPGSYDLGKPTSVLDAIALAGGLQDFAKASKIYILRRMPDGSQRMLPFNYKHVIKGDRSAQNFQLRAGDTVVVP